MRRADREMEDPSEIEAVLHQNRVVVLGVVDGDEPYLVTVNYGYADNKLYLHGAKEGRKASSFATNPRLCFTVTDQHQLIDHKSSACHLSYGFRSVVGYGRVRELESDQEKTLAFEALLGQVVRPEHKVSKTLLRQTACWVIDIESMTGKQQLLPEHSMESKE
ncbi:pyridoxamine 5'-phosphate oxidase family protein [Dongshaea marina]|uniref:pyridoxamine 5'-phosphate oxidase family protein n=1 Tax=Dongshaea marina TaxID=2047966 RepID=UPI000D3E547F|nr:pyridoxamine 5'-phosphate oxidase family protein [Dongshaea marina]